jgi:hypothetical protein
MTTPENFSKAYRYTEELRQFAHTANLPSMSERWVVAGSACPVADGACAVCTIDLA